MILWLEAHTPECVNSITANDNETTPLILDSFFTFPNNTVSWEDIEDFTVTVNVGEITGFALPESNSDYLYCSSIDFNNEWDFPEPWYSMASGNTYETELTSPMSVSLLGPLYSATQAAITGSQTANSRYTSCSAPTCSSATYIEDQTLAAWEIADMAIFMSNTVTLTSGTLSYDIKNVHISSIWAPGHIEFPLSQPPLYVIDAGEAWFSLTGRGSGNGVVVQIPVSNATDIEASLISGEWTIGSFDLEFIDANSDIWTITIPSSTWEE